MINSQPHKISTMRRIQRIHFVGIGGTGMCGIAEVLHNIGYEISGSDTNETVVTKRLKELGIEVFKGHQTKWVETADVVVISSAINTENPEVKRAHELKIPVIPRAQMLAELMRFRHGIAVAGTHGKTTTTSLVASILTEAGLDPTFVIGGRLNSMGVNASLGESNYFVAEADESDASFLYLQPMMAVITNIDADHMETYGHDFGKLRHTFIDFIKRIPFYGLAVVCIDDPQVQNIMPDITCSTLTYGFSEEADIRATDFTQVGLKSYFTVTHKRDRFAPFNVELNMPGKHNALNALAAIGIAHDIGIKPPYIQAALKQFKGVGRRSQVLGEIMLPEAGKAMLIDDYGHHPLEVECTMTSLKAAFPESRIVLLYQPHRYSRTQAHFDEFVKSLSQADILLLLEVYPAGEKPISGADSQALCRAMRQQGVSEPVYIKTLDNVPDVLKRILKNGDVLVTQGAGSIGKMATTLAQNPQMLIQDENIQKA